MTAHKQLTIHECHAQGMSIRQAAEAMGVGYRTAYSRARRAGLKFRKDYSASAERMRKLNADPEFAAANAERMSKRMRKLNADPKFAAAHAERMSKQMRKLHADPEFNPLAALSDSERADYDILKKNGMTRAEAFKAIGRDDLNGDAA